MCLKSTWRLHIGRLCLVSLTAWLCVACAATPATIRDLRLQLGLEQPLVHQDVPAAASLSGFSRQVALSQAQRITVRVGAGGAPQTITDPALVSQAIGLLHNGTLQPSMQQRLHSQTLVQIQFYLRPPERTVTMYYDPSTQILRAFNTPTQAWPDHVVADYQVPVSFGQEFFAALHIAP
jgi:hypothetical protein